MMLPAPGWFNRYYINTDQIITIKDTSRENYPSCEVEMSDGQVIKISTTNATDLANMINEALQT